MSVSAKKGNAVREVKPDKNTPEAATYAIVTEEVGNYEKHPFFIKKANKAKETLKRVGLPESIKLRHG
jgi:hypothetical protein